LTHIDPLRAVARSDPRYRLEAYTFLYDALDATVRTIAERRRTEGDENDRHVSGQQLLEGMRIHAIGLFGPLAAQVWRSWGVRDTEDWGRIVFNLVESGLLRRQDSDTIEDFRGGYDFDAAFVDAYEPTLPTELDAVPRPGQGADGDGDDD